jgi:hypothetical protein
MGPLAHSPHNSACHVVHAREGRTKQPRLPTTSIFTVPRPEITNLINLSTSRCSGPLPIVPLRTLHGSDAHRVLRDV